jgi:hypothetical protein
MVTTNRYFGTVGFAETIEKAAGVWEDVIVEKQYYGDVLRNTRSLVDGQQVNDNLVVNNSISIVADPYASEHFFAMRYISWAGTRWTVTDVEVRSPRLLLRLGEVYNGPTPAPVTP